MKFLLVISFLWLAGCGQNSCCTFDSTNKVYDNTLYAYGDSIVAGSLTAGVSYSSLVAQRVGLNIQNNAIAGTTVIDPNQHDKIISSQWPKGSVILFTPGINDANIHQRDSVYIAIYLQDMRDVVQKLHEAQVRAYIGTPVSVLPNSNLNNDTVQIYANINRQVVQEINDPNIKLIDFNIGYVPTTSTDIDWLHPNMIGTQQMADYFFKNM